MWKVEACLVEIKVEPYLKSEVCEGVVEDVHGAVLPPHLQLYLTQPPLLKNFKKVRKFKDAILKVLKTRQTAKEGPMRIQYECLIPIYEFPSYFQSSIIKFCLPISTFMYLWGIYIFPRSVWLFCCRKICGMILEIYKLLADTWM